MRMGLQSRWDFPDAIQYSWCVQRQKLNGAKAKKVRIADHFDMFTIELPKRWAERSAWQTGRLLNPSF